MDTPEPKFFARPNVYGGSRYVLIGHLESGHREWLARIDHMAASMFDAHPRFINSLAQSKQTLFFAEGAILRSASIPNWCNVHGREVMPAVFRVRRGTTVSGGYMIPEFASSRSRISTMTPIIPTSLARYEQITIEVLVRLGTQQEPYSVHCWRCAAPVRANCVNATGVSLRSDGFSSIFLRSSARSERTCSGRGLLDWCPITFFDSQLWAPHFATGRLHHDASFQMSTFASIGGRCLSHEDCFTEGWQDEGSLSDACLNSRFDTRWEVPPWNGEDNLIECVTLDPAPAFRMAIGQPALFDRSR